MCILSGGVRRVSDTEILVFPTDARGWQVTIYSNRVQLLSPAASTPATTPWHTRDHGASKSVVAMVLPFPAGECKMIDISDSTDLFKALRTWFIPHEHAHAHAPQERGGGCLEVQRCGSYRYSVVPSLSDFDRVDASVFELTPRVASLLATSYGTGYSFLVCILDANAKYAPIAYRHPTFEQALFIPTLHSHDHSHRALWLARTPTPQDAAIGGKAGDPRGDVEPAAPDWDHPIYVLGSDTFGEPAEVDAADVCAALKRQLGGDGALTCRQRCICWQCRRRRRHLPGTRAFLPSTLFRQRRITGNDHPNKDMVVPVVLAA
jgi:hypothetical protein